MKRSTKIWLIAIAVVLVYLVIAIGVSVGLKLHGLAMWGLIVALTLAGVVSAWLVVRFMKSQDAPEPTGPPAGSPEAILAAARAQLAVAQKISNPKYGSLPVLLVVGPEGSTKTTTVIRSGLDPE